MYVKRKLTEGGGARVFNRFTNWVTAFSPTFFSILQSVEEVVMIADGDEEVDCSDEDDGRR